MAKISELLYEVDTNQFRVPRFQRGWVWDKNRVRELFKTLYRGHPVGSLISWPTTSEKGSPVNDIIDGQQRLTAIYGVIKGKKPPWFREESDGALRNLMFNVDTQRFDYENKEILSDPEWIDVASLFQEGGHESWSDNFKRLTGQEANGSYHRRIARLINIQERQINVEKLPDNVSVEQAAELFKHVNRAGKRVSEGDLVLGQISLRWEDAKENLQAALDEWRTGRFSVSLEWLLHTMSASLSGEASKVDGAKKIDIGFDAVRDATQGKLVSHFKSIQSSASEVFNHVRDTLGIDATVSTSINNGMIVLVVGKTNERSLLLDSAGQMRSLVGWWLLSTVHNRWSADVKNRTNADLASLMSGSGAAGLVKALSIDTPSLAIRSEEFARNRSAKSYYRLVQTLTRRRGALDLRSGVTLSFDQFGPKGRLEGHHIFPRSYLSKANMKKDMIDQLANLALISKGSNLKISSKSPADYLPELEEKNPGVLASQWIPNDPKLWTVRAYPEFLATRSELLAQEANKLMEDLLGKELWTESTS